MEELPGSSFRDDGSGNCVTITGTCLTSLEAMSNGGHGLVELFTHSFFLRAGSVGMNLSFWDPCLVISEDFFARLPIAFGADSPGVLEDAPGSFVGLLSVIEICESKTREKV